MKQHHVHMRNCKLFPCPIHSIETFFFSHIVINSNNRCVLLGKPRYNVNRVRHLMSRSIVGDLDLPNDETSRVRTHYS
jgi:hypothetical protein